LDRLVAKISNFVAVIASATRSRTASVVIKNADVPSWIAMARSGVKSSFVVGLFFSARQEI
jgi:hypothetical protein